MQQRLFYALVYKMLKFINFRYLLLILKYFSALQWKIVIVLYAG